MRKTVLAFCSVALVFVISDGVSASGFNLIPSITVREEYTDNLFFREDSPIDDFITTISPGLRFVDRSQKLDVSLDAQGQGTFYKDNDDLDNFDQDYRGAIAYRFNPRLNVSVDARYTVDSRRDRDIETTGLVLTSTERKRAHGGLSGTLVLSERTNASLSYAYDQDDFEDLRFVDYTYHVSQLGFTHDLDRFLARSVGRMNLGYYQYDSSQSTIDVYSATAGFSRALTEAFSLLVDLGARFTRSEFLVAGPDPFNPIVMIAHTEKGEGWGGVGQVALSYRGEATSASLSAVKDIRPASGSNGMTDRTSFSFSIRHRLTEKLSANLAGEYFLNKADTRELGTTKIDQQTVNVRPGLRYDITDKFVLTATYALTESKRREADTDVSRNLFFVQVAYQYPLFE